MVGPYLDFKGKDIKQVFITIMVVLVATGIIYTLEMAKCRFNDGKKNSVPKDCFEEALIAENRGGLEARDEHGVVRQFGQAAIVSNSWSALPDLRSLEVAVAIGKITRRVIVCPADIDGNTGEDLDDLAARLNRRQDFSRAVIFARLPAGGSDYNVVWAKPIRRQPVRPR